MLFHKIIKKFSVLMEEASKIARYKLLYHNYLPKWLIDSFPKLNGLR